LIGKIAGRELSRLKALNKVAIPPLRAFVIGAWNHVLHPSEALNLEGAWYVDLVCEELTLITVGTLRRLGRFDLVDQLLAPFGKTNATLPDDLTATKNLLINIPPRCTKTTIVTICWPCWEWLLMGWLPDLCLSYGQNLASEHNDDRRKLIESDWYKGFARDIKLSRSLNRITEFENDQRGKMVGRGLNAGVTGGGGIRIIFDDPNDPNTVESDPIRSRTAAAFWDYSTTRRNNPELCAVVVVQQRTHDRDVSGLVLEDPEGWRIVIIQMESEQQTQFVFPLSDRVLNLAPGDIMHPTRFGPEVIKGLKRNPQIWAGRYQQRPTASGGGMFKFANWRLYAELPRQLDRTILSIDTTFGSGPNSDYVAIGVIAQKLNVRTIEGPDGESIKEHEYYLRHVRRGQWDIMETEAEIHQTIKEFPSALTRLIENKANGPAIISRLNTVVKGLVPFNPRSSKLERAASIQPIQHRGDVLIPIAEWAKPALLEMGLDSISVEDWWALNSPPSKVTAHIPVDESFRVFLDELALFPVGANDDQVDMLSMGLIWLEQKPKANFTSFSTAPYPLIGRGGVRGIGDFFR
jgi:phage terminase large subunit-like protein